MGGGDRAMAKGKGEEQAPIIIKKKKGGHGGHHGGAWKVAYADFVTAMMAFFLLLWLLNVTTSDQKKGVADYFAPVSISRTTSGAGGVLGGRSMSSPGAKMSPSSSIVTDAPVSGVPGAATENTDDDADSPEEPAPPKSTPDDSASGGRGAQDQGSGQGGSQGAGSGQGADAAKQRLDKAQSQLEQAAERLGIEGQKPGESLRQFEQRVSDATPVNPNQRTNETREQFRQRLDQAAERLGLEGQHPGEGLQDFANRVAAASNQLGRDQGENQQFQETTTSIRQAIQSIPDLKEVAKSLIVDQTPEGLRIQIVDQEGLPMFPAGSGQMMPRTREIMDIVAKAIRNLPNKVAISGYTDSAKFARPDIRDNWDLSADRANATRRALVAAGLSEDRIDTVVGKADREPLVKDDPNSPRNRRISIVLLRENKSSGGAPAPK